MTIARPSSASAISAEGAGSIRDFADWLPPMLVKELRQGLRANIFVWSFVALQAAMIVLLGLRFTANEDDGQGPGTEDWDWYQWMAIGVSLLVLLPLRGITAISEESRQQTLDLVQLTHMSSLRLVADKWLALVSQTLLLVITLLPYQILYYFVGGVDVVANLLALGGMLLASLVLTALCIAVSPGSMLVRMVVLGPVGLFLCRLIMEMSRNSRSGGAWEPANWMLICMGVMYTLFALVIASARISRPVEQSPAKIRVTALATVVVMLVGAGTSDRILFQPWFTLSMPLLIWAGLEAMTERASALPSVYLPWVRRGWPGRWLGRIFYPGWGTGLLFVLVVTMALLCGSMLMQPLPIVFSDPASRSLAMVHLGMAIVFPAVVLSFLPHRPQRHWIYVFVQILCGLWFVEGSNIEFKSEFAQGMFFGGNPTSAFLWHTSQYGFTRRGLTDVWQGNRLMALLVDGAMLIFLFIRCRTEFRTIREGERQALLLLKPAANPSPAGTAEVLA